MASFEQAYPHITSWVQDGCLEIGSISYYDDSFIRAIDEGGTVWESPAQFETLDEALAAADRGIAEWCSINMPELVVEKDAQPSFTAKQGQYLSYIYNYTQIHGRPPAQADIQSFFRVTPPTVHQMILKLEKEGLLARVAGEARSLHVLIPAEQLPVLVRP
ncbi:transcriptional regulator [Leptolyngbya sp. Heron Island J]|uniref:LexA family protein n=1 Tax=Leptolyngbya sp. Heron Island J TaxID=1385935 RepID=UPI00029E1BFB|nr:MarR family winged helix-turn-helix transcriptional regulator [Leptolyngbya sp. Heron Island J]EKV03394.1 Mn-dependent transcriptional regulator [Leptolyngbya sp. PCC 7375]ESA38145.1 transcriptional regulator [Leptolyngbya sp. Heron Island J]